MDKKIGEVEIDGLTNLLVGTEPRNYPNGHAERRVLLVIKGHGKKQQNVNMTKATARVIISLLRKAIREG